MSEMYQLRFTPPQLPRPAIAWHETAKEYVYHDRDIVISFKNKNISIQEAHKELLYFMAILNKHISTEAFFD